MKRTQRKDAFRNIRKKLVSFLSLILIVFLGVMGYFATSYIGRDLKDTTEQFYQEQNFKDIIMASSLGVGESEVARIKELDSVADAEGVTLLSAQLKKGSTGISVTMLTRTERISLPQVTEGRLPETDTEVALGDEAIRRLGARLGDQLTMKVTDPLLPGALKEESFTLVGRIVQPEYLRKSRTMIAMVSPRALDPAVTMESFTRVYIKARLSGKNDILSQAYLDEVAGIIPELKELTETLGITRLDSIKNQALDRLSFLDNELLAPVKNFLKSLTMDQLIGQLVEDPEDLVPKLKEVAEKARGEWKDLIPTLLEQMPAEWQESISTTLGLGSSDIQAEAGKLLEQLADTIEKNTGTIEKVVKGTNWVILDNRSDEGYLDMRSNVNSCIKISIAYGGLFALVSMLVCFSTLTIIINEQKKQIGATKAFGFFSREVFGKYLLFGLGAALAGTLLGFLLGDILARLVINSYIKSFVLTRLVHIRPWWILLAVLLGVLLLIVLAAWIACKHVLKSPAAALVNGTDQLVVRKKVGKARSGEAKKGSLYSRLIMRNMLSELPRVIISVIIIGGSLAIMGVGFTLKMATEGMVEKQVQEINLYDYRVTYDPGINEEAIRQLKEDLSAAGYEYLDAVYETHIFESPEGQEALNLVAAAGDGLTRYLTVRDPASKAPLDLPREGILIQLRMSETYHLKAGDSISLRDNNLGDHAARIEGVFDNYSGRLIITTLEGYEAVLGEKARYNTLYTIKTREDADEGIFKRLPEDFVAESSNVFANRFKSFMSLFDVVIVVLIGMSTLLSFLILTNLTNIFVSRKKKELIIMRVNGFSVKEDIGYLSRETVLTAILGVILGIGGGILLARFVISIMEQPDVQLLRQPILLAWVLATVLEVSFAFIISFLAFRKVKHFRLSEIGES